MNPTFHFMSQQLYCSVRASLHWATLTFVNRYKGTQFPFSWHGSFSHYVITYLCHYLNDSLVILNSQKTGCWIKELWSTFCLALCFASASNCFINNFCITHVTKFYHLLNNCCDLNIHLSVDFILRDFKPKSWSAHSYLLSLFWIEHSKPLC